MRMFMYYLGGFSLSIAFNKHFVLSYIMYCIHGKQNTRADAVLRLPLLSLVVVMVMMMMMVVGFIFFASGLYMCILYRNVFFL